MEPITEYAEEQLEQLGWHLHVDGVLALCVQASAWHQVLSTLAVSAERWRLSALVEIVSLVFGSWRVGGAWVPKDGAISEFLEVGQGTRDGGQGHYEAVRMFLDEVRADAKLAAPLLNGAAASLLKVANRLQAVSAELSRGHMHGEVGEGESRDYFFAVGYIALIWILVKRARLACEAAQHHGRDTVTWSRYERRIQAARYFCDIELPRLVDLVQRLFDHEGSQAIAQPQLPLPLSCEVETESLHV